MNRHLLLVSLGPVQEFIASARRCRDLWFGSWLLSELSKAAALGVVRAAADPGAVEWLVFPGATGVASLERRDTAVANRVLARVEGDLETTGSLAEAGRAAVAERLRELTDDAFARVGRGDPDRARHFHEARARAQVAELIEYLWVAVPETAAGYAAARAEAERLMAARKATMTWSQPPWAAAGVPKSSLDGVRESVLDERIFDGGAANLDAERRRRWYGVHGAERLCGVGLLKRHGRGVAPDGTTRTATFHSTSHVAALPWIVGVENDEERRDAVADALDGLRKILGDVVREELRVGPKGRESFFGDLDGAALFPGRLRQVLRERGAGPTLIDQADRALARALAAARRGEPTPYLALLVADGDRMGAVIDAQTSFEAHRELSLALARFAGEARGIVLDHEGSPIYAGGDDVLALLPLHEALACAETLSDRFREGMKAWKAPDGRTPTLSAGIALVHHTMPLGDALQVAREAERLAKDEAGRDALAIIERKRGGSPLVVHGRWDRLLPRLRRLIDLRHLDAVSERAAYDLEELEELDPGAGEAEAERLRELQRLEAVRVLSRKRAERGQRAVAQKVLAELVARIERDALGPARLSRELRLASLFARAESQAGRREVAS